MKKRYLNNFRDVRRYLSDIAHRLETGTLDRQMALALKDIANAVIYDLKEEAFARNVAAIEENNKLMAEMLVKLGEVKR